MERILLIHQKLATMICSIAWQVLLRRVVDLVSAHRHDGNIDKSTLIISRIIELFEVDATMIFSLKSTLAS